MGGLFVVCKQDFFPGIESFNCVRNSINLNATARGLEIFNCSGFFK